MAYLDPARYFMERERGNQSKVQRILDLLLQGRQMQEQRGIREEEMDLKRQRQESLSDYYEAMKKRMEKPPEPLKEERLIEFYSQISGEPKEEVAKKFLGFDKEEAPQAQFTVKDIQNMAQMFGMTPEFIRSLPSEQQMQFAGEYAREKARRGRPPKTGGMDEFTQRNRPLVRRGMLEVGKQLTSLDSELEQLMHRLTLRKEGDPAYKKVKSAINELKKRKNNLLAVHGKLNEIYYKPNLTQEDISKTGEYLSNLPAIREKGLDYKKKKDTGSSGDFLSVVGDILGLGQEQFEKQQAGKTLGELTPEEIEGLPPGLKGYAKDPQYAHIPLNEAIVSWGKTSEEK